MSHDRAWHNHVLLESFDDAGQERYPASKTTQQYVQHVSILTVVPLSELERSSSQGGA